MKGKFYIVGTPIGNREDITLRALKTLYSMDVVLCEDTRATGKLLGLYEKELLDVLEIGGDIPRLERFDDKVEKRRVVEVLEWLGRGKSVALVSNAGMPLVSDPGFLLVCECWEQGIVVEVIPGPSALTAAMSVAGVPVDKVMFLGFLPKRPGKRSKVWRDLIKLRENEIVIPTVVIYESPFRLKKTVEEIVGELNNPEVVLVGELTKMHEQVIRGRASEVLKELDEKAKGEWVIKISSKLKAKS